MKHRKSVRHTSYNVKKQRGGSDSLFIKCIGLMGPKLCRTYECNDCKCFVLQNVIRKINKTRQNLFIMNIMFKFEEKVYVKTRTQLLHTSYILDSLFVKPVF